MGAVAHLQFPRSLHRKMNEMSFRINFNNAESCDVQPNGLLMTKYQRGRLKKLKKRASKNGDSDPSVDVKKKRKKHSSTSVSCSSLSGIRSWEDVTELENLLQLERKENSTVPSCDGSSINTCFGPSLHLLKASPQLRYRQTCTGTDHRDLILYMLFHDGNSISQDFTKNQRMKEERVESVDRGDSGRNMVDEGDVSRGSGRRTSSISKCDQLQAWAASRIPLLPSWARLHNPAYATHLAVIELSFHSGVFNDIKHDVKAKDSCLASFIESNLVCKALCAPSGLHGHQALWLHTRLFEGENPKRASAILGNVDRERFTSPLALPPSEKGGNRITSRDSSLSVDKSITESSSTSQVDLFDRLRALILSPQQLISEGYPAAPSKFDGDFISSSANLDLILELNNISVALQHLVDTSTTLTPDVPIINSSDSFPFTREDADKLVTRFESYMLHDHSSPVSNLSYLSTFQTRKNNAKPNIFCIDCEMVKTTVGLELARVTLLKLEQQKSDNTATCKYTIVLDMLVKPKNRVIDFLTKYSGITPQSLDGVSISIQEVQVALLGLISKEDIIVGHSLENDLHALRLCHQCVVDTAVLFRTGGKKHALRHLSLVLLKRRIQDGTIGHCSVEDAAAALELAFSRAKFGSDFKIHYKGRHEMHLMELIDSVRKRHDGDQGFAVTREKGSLVCIGSTSWIEKCVSTQSSAHTLICEDISCSSRNSICSWIKSDRRKASLLLASMCIKESHHVSLIDGFLNEIVCAAPPTTMVLVVFQNGFETAHTLTEQRKALNNPKATLRWDSGMEEKWRYAVEKCRNCEAIWIGFK